MRERLRLRDLLVRCAQSDEAALAEFYAVTSPFAWRVALCTLASVAEAEDALVKTYASVWRQSDTFVGTQLSAWAWTLGILREHLGAAQSRP